MPWTLQPSVEARVQVQRNYDQGESSGNVELGCEYFGAWGTVEGEGDMSTDAGAIAAFLVGG